jgi:hypothetical protein
VIDWPSIVFNTLWIVGCAVTLAAFSYANWLAHLQGVRTRQLLSAPNIQLSFVIGLGLISLGLFFLSRGWLEYVLWAVVFIFSAWQSWRLWRGSPK